jgi:hypothetical protein
LGVAQERLGRRLDGSKDFVKIASNREEKMQNSKGFWTGSPGRGFLLGALALAGIGLAGGGDASAANFKDALP